MGDLIKGDSLLLRAGDPAKKALVVFYDSRVGTHSEYMGILEVKQIFKRAKKFDVVLIDLAGQTPEDVA